MAVVTTERGHMIHSLKTVLNNPALGQRITRTHPQYNAVTTILMRYPELRVPANPDMLRVPDEHVWLHGRELLVQVWKIDPSTGGIKLNDAHDQALTEPGFIQIPID